MIEAIKNFLGTTGVAQLFAESNWWQYLIMYIIVGALFYLAIVKKFEPLLLMPIAFGMLLANLPGANLIHLEYFFDDYYIAFNETGEAIGVLANYFNDFIAKIDAEFAANALYSIKDGVCTFDFSSLADAEKETVFQMFRETMGNFASLDDGGLHIKMTTMIKEVVNNGGLVDILYLGVKLGVYPSLIFLGVGAMTDFSPLIANPKSLFMESTYCGFRFGSVYSVDEYGGDGNAVL